MKEKTEVHDKAHEADNTRNKELTTEETNVRDKQRVDDVGDDIGFTSLGW